MEQSKDNKIIPMTSVDSGKLREVTPDVAYYTNQIVNLIMIGNPGGDWVLVDAGMPKSGKEIIKVAQQRFGENNSPKAIILTHGHFDHVGSIVDLIEKWNVPVYAHSLESTFLTGMESYPQPDTSVEGGVLAKISSVYPHEPINISEVLQQLPDNGEVPYLIDWEWIHVPGHSPGQVALYRERDGVLISADALITVKQDSLYKVLIQKEEICGPPVYLTTNWSQARESVEKLAALNPQILVPGHGTAMSGPELKSGIEHLLANWEEEAVPSHGRWVWTKDL
ncbi:MBL fold metallo-hydrolase [Chryseobacterium sp. 6424]|uniref:MBL fold metallo-hydrolase n=1 Tax=Chryseobacterium sp. 6424 TaxID=2039166 RepID=UPI000EFAE01F|nr:MBL fold metallo-hydrolase [Chryseobacterium sp. 6424]AYO58250.1 MBL fold metallo-hydrolase [Chryseobacterium sp. 6424]